MCGIVGIASAGPPPDVRSLEVAASLIRHRGPDDHGIMRDGVCALAHRRLSILDLSAAGRQPMQADGLPVWITFNGEIYNYLELKQRLESSGWNFRSATDTEVILKGYVQWGPEVLGMLRGMYALGIWDGRDRSLLLARDPFAIKPLYYCHRSDGTLIFASELKALRGLQPDLGEIDWSALAQFFRYQSIPEPLSIYAAVRRLPAGHSLTWRAGRVTEQPHVRNLFAPSVPSVPATDDEVLEVLQESVARHIIADVPVGAFLSGGVDSSLVAALMCRASSDRVHSFSIAYDGAEDFDESIYARMVARHLGTDHHELKIDPSLVQQTERVLGFFDEPFANPAALIAAALSEFTRQYVKVALSGVGGDEFFGGYPRYLAVGWLPWLDMLPSPASHAIGCVLDLIPSSTDRKQSTDRARRLLCAARRGRGNFYDDLMGYATPAAAARLLSPDLPANTVWRDPKRLAADGNIGNRRWAMASDVASYLPSDLLTYTDRCSMAFGLEVRTPLVDREVAAVSTRLDARQLLAGLQTKRLLKAVAARLVPRRAIYRKKKGFSVPVARWLRGELRELFADALADSRLRAAPELNASGIAEVLGRHRAGDNSVAHVLWSVFVYMLWRERVVQSPCAAVPGPSDLHSGARPLRRGHCPNRYESLF